MMKKITAFILLSVSLYLPAAVGGFNARGEVLGETAAVLADDVNAVSANPGLLSTIKKKSVNLTTRVNGYAMESDNMAALTAHAGFPIKANGALGVNVETTFNTVVANGNKSLLYSEWLLNAGYGHNIKNKVRVGGSLRLNGTSVNEDFLPDDVEAGKNLPEIDLNAGVNVTINEHAALSFVLGNFFSTFSEAGSDIVDERPLFFQTGVGLSKEGVGNGGRVRGALTFKFLVSETKPVFGLAGEYFIKDDIFRITAGMKVSNSETAFVPKVGFGLSLKSFQTDYAFSYPASKVYVAGIHTVSVGVSF